MKGTQVRNRRVSSALTISNDVPIAVSGFVCGFGLVYGFDCSFIAARSPERKPSSMRGWRDRDRQSQHTSGDFAGHPFPSLARRAWEQQFLWRDANWITRLFTTLTIPQVICCNPLSIRVAD